ncbi:hypothetical protein D3C72_1459910 [compost metagenome]
MAQGFTCIAIAGAPAAGLVDHQFVVGLDLEHGRVYVGVVGDSGLDARFQVGAGGWFQLVIEAAARARVKQFIQGGRFEAARGAGVHVDVRRQFIQQTQHRCRVAELQAAAVVAIAEIVVVD